MNLNNLRTVLQDKNWEREILKPKQREEEMWDLSFEEPPERRVRIDDEPNNSFAVGSKPIMCPQRRASSVDEDELEKSEEKYYNSKTWNMYHRINAARQMQRQMKRRTATRRRRSSIDHSSKFGNSRVMRRDSFAGLQKKQLTRISSMGGGDQDSLDTMFVLEL